MQIKVMETDPDKLRLMAKDWGADILASCSVGLLQRAIVEAYLKALYEDTRRAMRARASQK